MNDTPLPARRADPGASAARRKVRRYLAMGALTIGLVGGTLGVQVTGVVQAHNGGNGCTLSPDSSYFPVYYNFHDTCDRHDVCYDTKPFGDSTAGRKACDDRFRADMKSWCNNRYGSTSPARYACRGVADTYYGAVRTFGGAFF